MWVVDRIVEYLFKISSFFYTIYLECWYAYYIPAAVANLFWDISSFFSSLGNYFNSFGYWVVAIANQVADMMSWSTIQSYILGWLPNLDDINLWFYSWWSNVTSAITSWWSATQYTVQSWIDTASSWLQSQLDSLTSRLAELQYAWDEFKGRIPSLDEVVSWFTDWWGNVLNQLTTWWDDRLIDITGLIDTAFILRQGFWEGWLDWKDSIIEFIQDPWQFLYDRLEDLFDRFW